MAEACAGCLHPVQGGLGDTYLVFGPKAAAVIIDAYKAGMFPLRGGGRIRSTTRAERYALSPLRVRRFAIGPGEA